tara:strand:+ start:248 stop:1609 length:1362 start_codon:yes stop_codon:yes gene_type:complete
VGNRAFIQFGTGTGKNAKHTGLGVYMHWNGGRDTIEPLLKVARELRKESSKATIDVGRDIDNFVFLAKSRGFNPQIETYKPDPKLGYDKSWASGADDNGLYEIDDLKIVKRRTMETYMKDEFTEQSVYDPKEMAQSIRESVSDTYIQADDWHKEHFPKEKVAREKAKAQREKERKEYFKSLNNPSKEEQEARKFSGTLSSLARTRLRLKENPSDIKFGVGNNWDKSLYMTAFDAAAFYQFSFKDWDKEKFNKFKESLEKSIELEKSLYLDNKLNENQQIEIHATPSHIYSAQEILKDADKLINKNNKKTNSSADDEYVSKVFNDPDHPDTNKIKKALAEENNKKHGTNLKAKDITNFTMADVRRVAGKKTKPNQPVEDKWERQAAFNKETKERVEDLEDRTSAINLAITLREQKELDRKAVIKKAVSKSKSFKMPKTKKDGASGGLGFKLKKR